MSEQQCLKCNRAVSAMNAADRFTMITALVRGERESQDLAWGADRHHPDALWSLILAEEIGEAAKASLENEPADVFDELVQSAAVIFAWLDDRLRSAEDP